jgi:hypothetical protein
LARERALPFRAPSPDSAPAIVLPLLPHERVATDTFAILPEDDNHFSERAVLPFFNASRAPPLPAAPLEEAPSEATPIQEIPIAAAPEIANVAPPEPPAPPHVEAASPASPWAPAPPAPPEPPAPPPRARPVLPTPSPVLTQSLYNRFDRKG